MPVTTPPAIDTLPAAPDPADRSTFNTRAYPWAAALPAFSTQIGAVASNVAANATDAAASATAASGSATTAGSHATNAGISATLAQNWAIQIGTPVSGGEYSAKHYAQQAAAAVAAIPAGTINDSTTSDTSVWSSSKVSSELGGKQATLVSGTNIKTINSNSLVGSGDLAVQPTLVSGTNIKTINGQSVIGSGDLTIGGGYTLIDAITPTNGVTEVVKTGLPACSRLYVAFASVGFAAAPTSVWFFISANGGSTWSTEQPSIGNQTTQTAMLEVLGGNVAGQPKPRHHNSTSGSYTAGVITSVTGVINAIKFSTQSGTTFTGSGTIYIYGMA